MSLLRVSPLDKTHRSLDAKMVEFGGWDMPISYPSGTITEHLACRNGAVIFDVSHLGTVRVEGYYAKAALQEVLTNDLDKISVGQTQYTQLLNQDGGVLDDIIVWWVNQDRFDVMPNASNTQQVVRAIGGVDVTESRAVLAVQGPKSRECLGKICAEFKSVARNTVRNIVWQNVSYVVAGTGYTGEDGLEIAVPKSHAEKLFNAVVSSGVMPAGLGARDTLRLEAGLPLHGHELSPSITPLEAQLKWAVAFNKPKFAGKRALEAQLANGLTRLLVGVTTLGRRPPREGCDVLIDCKKVGTITSGNFSPILEHGIAFALVDAFVKVGDKVVVDVRGTQIEGTVVKPPFIAKK
ncbi:MAG: glycine cleavage system aminomethyltransferase GcvT [Actinomycetota bacterium]|nr:glycine cleavage system aminomethyltransferase GcvT [Actinomycetota bacterium]